MQASSGVYRRWIFPWINDKLNADPDLLRIRAEALQAAQGRTLEIGFGTGLNMPYYPPAVTGLVAVEPNVGMLERAAGRIRDAGFPVEALTCDAEQLPLRDRDFDTAVSVLTLCSVGDPARALSEIHRVLRDDGRLVVVEHGLSEVANIAKWQHRLDWLQSKVACGCHLNRPIGTLLVECGFRTETVRRFFAPKMPPTHGWLTVGTALKGTIDKGSNPFDRR